MTIQKFAFGYVAFVVSVAWIGVAAELYWIIFYTISGNYAWPYVAAVGYVMLLPLIIIAVCFNAKIALAATNGDGK